MFYKLIFCTVVVKLAFCNSILQEQQADDFLVNFYIKYMPKIIIIIAQNEVIYEIEFSINHLINSQIKNEINTKINAPTI